VGAARFPFPTSRAPAALDDAAVLRAELDDYLLPRVNRIDAPLLCVVGGSTGAGKSTLVNSLVRAPVSPAGALRPTTRDPLLVCHPADAPAFAERAVLPALARRSQPGERGLQIVNAPLLAAGMALLDAPDIDSVVSANRTLARELFAAGDLWLFVTTAARYADAVPWRVLREARRRGTAVAIVLDRVPPATREDIAGDFAAMLAAGDLANAPLFVVTETALDRHGLLPELDVAPVKRWLDTVAHDLGRRRQIARRTLGGAVAALGPRLEDLARAADEQAITAATLAGQVRSAYAGAMTDVEERVRGGAMLRGPVYAGWQDLVVAGELDRALRAAAGGRRGTARGTPEAAGQAFRTELGYAIVNLVVAADVRAAQACRRLWETGEPGRAILATDASLGRPWAGFADAAHDLVHAWQARLDELAGDRGLVLPVMVAAVAPPRADIAATGPGPIALRAVLDHPVAAELGAQARGDLLVRVGALLAAEVQRHLAPATDGADPGLAGRLREAGAALRSAGAMALGDAA
jgi:hypothetical protein